MLKRERPPRKLQKMSWKLSPNLAMMTDSFCTWKGEFFLEILTDFRGNAVKRIFVFRRFIAWRYCFWFSSANITNITQPQLLCALSFLSSQYLCFF